MKFYLLPDGTVSLTFVEGATEISRDQFTSLGGELPTDSDDSDSDKADALPDLSSLDVEEGLKPRHAELLAEIDAIGSPKTITELDKRNTLRAEANHYAKAINSFANATDDAVELVEGIVPDDTKDIDKTDPPAATPTGEAPKSAAPVADPKPGDTSQSADDLSNDNDGTGNLPAADPIVEMAAITAGANSTQHQDGSDMSFSDLGRAWADALASGSDGVRIIASLNQYGRANDNPNALGSDAVANHKTLFGGREDLTVTAAVCGPAEPIRRLPDCFQMGMPFSQVLTTQQVRYGSIQVYAPLTCPEDLDAVMIPGPECANCAPTSKQICLNAACVKPLDPIEAIPTSACLCVPEQLFFADDFVLEQYIKQLSTGYEQSLERWRMGVVRENSFVRQFTSPYGHSLGVKQAGLQIAANLGYKARCNEGVDLSDYYMVIPPGDKYAAMADEVNRVCDTANGGDDLVAWFESKGVTTIAALDFDLNGSISTDAPTGFTGELGNAGAAPLEGFHQTPSMYFVPRGKFLHGSPFDIEVGVDNRDKSEVESGCSKMIRREWHTPPVPFGCKPSVVVDFTEVCAAGTKPGAVDPVCNGALAGQAADSILTLGDGPVGE